MSPLGLNLLPGGMILEHKLNLMGAHFQDKTLAVSARENITRRFTATRAPPADGAAFLM